MKITIDTKDDSHEDIRKVISLLSKMIGEGHVSSGGMFGSSISSSSENSEEPTVATNAFANMFGGDSENVTPVLEPTTASEDDDVEEASEGVQVIEY